MAAPWLRAAGAPAPAAHPGPRAHADPERAVDAAALSDPAEPGPFAVGHARLALEDPARHGRPVPTELWYPVDPDRVSGEPTSYPLAGPIGLRSPLAREGAPPTARRGLPLVVFSHGGHGVAVQSSALCEVLASHGFFVAAPSHTGDTQYDALAGREDPLDSVVRDRPRDVSFVIDRLLARSGDAADPIAGRIDPAAIGVTGHSLGGFTALAMAGGHADVAPDARVHAIVPVAASAELLSDAELERVKVPTLHLGGTKDAVSPLDPVTARAFALVNAPPGEHYRVDLDGATHGHFANVCEIGQALLDRGLRPFAWPFVGARELVEPWREVCVPPAWPIARAHRLQTLFTVAFFKSVLAGERGYVRFLTPGFAAEGAPEATVLRAASR